MELLNFGVELVKHGAKRVWQRIGGRNQPNPVRPEDPKMELRVEEGSFVKEGEVIARLESTDYSANIERAKAAILHAEADLAEARRQAGIA